MADALLDWWLLETFGYAKTLEELDGMDWGRFLRAQEMRRLSQLESRRQAFIAGQLSALTASEWDEIERIDRALKAETVRVEVDDER